MVDRSPVPALATADGKLQPHYDDSYLLCVYGQTACNASLRCCSLLLRTTPPNTSLGYLRAQPAQRCPSSYHAARRPHTSPRTEDARVLYYSEASPGHSRFWTNRGLMADDTTHKARYLTWAPNRCYAGIAAHGQTSTRESRVVIASLVPHHCGRPPTSTSVRML